MAFAHRGFAPSDQIAGGPDPADYAGDLAALIDHLGFAEVRLVGQSMGGWTMLEYAIAHPDTVKALVLSSTSGTIDRRGADPIGRPAVRRLAEGRRGQGRRGPRQGRPSRRSALPAAERFPALHLLYRSIDEMAGALDKEKVRTGLRRTATRTLDELQDFRVPTLLIAGGRRRCLSAVPRRAPSPQGCPAATHS